jgi:hypothetical protein
MNKKITWIAFVLFVVVAGFIYFDENKEKINNVVGTIKKEPTSLCYIYSFKSSRGFYDQSILLLDLSGENVSGEFRILPGEKDSKVGKFLGLVGPVDQKKMARVANVWWDSLAEGMKVKEELVLEFGDGSAVAGFGEMVDRGDGVYLYKDKTKLTYVPQMSQISCEDVAEKDIVEKYIKDNIKTIATDSPVLGGRWGVISLYVIPSINKGEVIYEDGHIQSKATFEYDYTESAKSVVVKNFLQNK